MFLRIIGLPSISSTAITTYISTSSAIWFDTLPFIHNN